MPSGSGKNASTGDRAKAANGNAVAAGRRKKKNPNKFKNKRSEAKVDTLFSSSPSPPTSSQYSEDLIFKHDKDDTFDRLVANSRPHPVMRQKFLTPSFSSATEEEDNLLFRSLEEEPEGEKSSSDNKTKKKPVRKPKKKTEKNDLPKDRVFSDETLNYRANYVFPRQQPAKSKTTGVLLLSHDKDVDSSSIDLFDSHPFPTAKDESEDRRSDSEILNCPFGHVSLVELSASPHSINGADEDDKVDEDSIFFNPQLAMSTPLLANITKRNKNRDRFQNLEESKESYLSRELEIAKNISTAAGGGQETNVGGGLGPVVADNTQNTVMVGDCQELSGLSDSGAEPPSVTKFSSTDQMAPENELSDKFQKRFQKSLSLLAQESLDDSEMLENSVIVEIKGGKHWRRRRTMFKVDGGVVSNRKTLAFFDRQHASPPPMRLSVELVLQQQQKLRRATFQNSAPIVTDDNRRSQQEVVTDQRSPFVTHGKKSAWRMASIINSSSIPLSPHRPSIASFILPTISEVADKTANEENVSLILEPTVSAISKVLSRCTVKEVMPFRDLLTEEALQRTRKIGEGSYGEVFLIPPDCFKLSSSSSSVNSAVLKIVPVDGAAEVNGSAQTKLEAMLAEICISSELSLLSESGRAPNFVRILACYVLEGSYPQRLLDLWDQFDNDKESENDRPDSALLPSDQRFMALVYSNGGKDLETTKLTNAAKGISVFMQVAHALAVAEETLQFEHRDLHWGNILVRDTAVNSIEYTIGGESFVVKTEKVTATIIDFTLSRMSVKGDRCEIFSDLSKDSTLFEAKGDYQFDIYRMMREEVRDDWREFHPKTNVFWLHYLLDKLVLPASYKLVSSKVHKKNMNALRKLKDSILRYDSAKQFVLVEGTRDVKEN